MHVLGCKCPILEKILHIILWCGPTVAFCNGSRLPTVFVISVLAKMFILRHKIYEAWLPVYEMIIVFFMAIDW